ncbi:FtsX-like permease family protein, partial [Bifidobacterium bifidum]
AGEVAVTKKFLADSGMAVGDSLTVTPVDTGTATSTVSDTDSADSGANGTEPTDEQADASQSAPSFPTELTITGTVIDPKDLSNPDGYSGAKAFRNSLASDYTFFAPSDGVTGDIYTAISLTVSGSTDEDAFGDDYDTLVRDVADRIEATVQTKQQNERRQTLVDAAQKKLDQAKTDAYRQLDDAQMQITEQTEELKTQRKQAKTTKQSLEDQLTQLEDQSEQLQDGKDQVNVGLLQARQGQSQLQQGIATAQTMNDLAAQGARAAEQAADAADQAVAGAQGLPETVLEPLRKAAKTARDLATQARSKADESAAQLTQLQSQLSQVNATIAQLEAQSATLQRQTEQLRGGRQQIRDGLKQIAAGEEQMDTGERQLKDAQDQLDAKRKDADSQFAKQQQRVDDIAAARWYVQTRSSIGGFSSLKSDISSIESIGYAFPVVFLIVAVLMSLTAMTRMVEEERGLIGTYTGLGYGNAAIAMRYVLFAALACLIGGGLGLMVGFLGIPSFLLLVIEGLYTVPGIQLEYDWLYGSAGIALFVVGVVVATVVACAGALRQSPAQLMQPKAPKAGARILLERIRPLWRRLSFLNKVTARNIFRFKSRLLMTVGGVAGCTALIVCGFAINDTVATLGPKQYEDIYHYDLLVVSGDDSVDAMRARLDKDGRVERSLDLRLDSGEMDAGDAGETIQLMIVPDDSAGALGDMITLRSASGGHGKLQLGGDGIIVAQSAANSLGVKAGDTVTLRDGSMRHGEVKVSAVTRNLIGSNVYVSESLYKKTFGVSAAVTHNAVIATLDGTADQNIAYADRLARDPSVVSATSTDDLERSFSFDLMSAVVALIIALAGGLALVVLFTLANTNVSERVREMATLKVLGFYDREVHRYVNKEMLILAGMGIVVGLPLGRAVGGLLTAALNMPSLYFEVSVHWYSYVIAAAATMAFALLVQLLTNPVLDRIDPVSSLKSVE